MRTISFPDGSSREVSSICFDSRAVESQCVFVAIRGEEHNGHEFIDGAIAQGASIIVHEDEVPHQNPEVTYIQVADSRMALAELAQAFYDYPSKKLKLVGVTGTNGKTTTATLLYNLFSKLGHQSALLSTIENRIGQQVFPATHTTPDPVQLASFLDQAVTAGCTHAFMECSSHAINQKRVWGLTFALAIFTNLTHDHLDYHGTLEAYGEAKKALFDTLPEGALALANGDDPQSQYMLQDTKARKVFYSLKDAQVEQSLNGLTLTYEGVQIRSKLVGTFNAYNILGIYLTAKLLEEPEDKILEAIATLLPPSGRLEFIKLPHEVYGVVDYAHTPDALENVLETLRKVISSEAHLITVVGCGGARDKSKRPIMGKLAYDLSDRVIFTSDNPRNEDAESILQDIVQDLPTDDKYKCEVDRAMAIKQAVGEAAPGDVVLVAGKGHEDYQILPVGKIHFSDQEILRGFSQ